jgi:transposase
MQDFERRDPAERDWPGDPPDEAGPDPEVSTEPPPQRRWSAEQKAQIVRESFWPGNRVSEVAQRYGLNRKQLSAWRTLARKGKLVLPSSTGPQAEPVVVACEPEREPAFATLELDPEPDRGSLGSVSIEARGVTVRLDGDIGAGRIAEIASALRALR